MKNITSLKSPEGEKLASTYSLLIRSEEKGRSVFETIVYALCLLSVVFAIGHVAMQPIAEPGSAYQVSTKATENTVGS